VEQVNNPNADTGQEEVHFSVRALLADRCFAPCTALKYAEAKVENGKATWTLKMKKSGTPYEVSEARASPEEIALLRKWLGTETSRLEINLEDLNKKKKKTLSKSTDLLNVFLSMLPEGETPSKIWSATAYRKETAWKMVAKAAVGANLAGAGVNLSWSVES